MSKRIRMLLWAALVLFAGNPVNGHGQTGQAPLESKDLSTMQFERIALMPFLIGRLEPPDNPIEKPLSLSLGQLKMEDTNLAEGAEQIMTRLVQHYLQGRYRDQMVPLESVTSAFEAVRRDPVLDTPRKLAVKFGERLQADLVVVGTIWRFREKGANKEVDSSPASVAFAVYLVDVASGQRLWRNAYDGSQKIFSEDVVGGFRQVKIDLRWISVTDLARLGVKNVFRKLPLR
jgi:nucleotide-binding universal stress UspA family protein